MLDELYDIDEKLFSSRGIMMLQDMLRLIGGALIFLGLLTATCGAERERFPAEMILDTYEAVSFGELRANPVKFSGAEIAVRGYFGRDFDWADTEYACAFYDKPLNPDGTPAEDSMKISISGFYFHPLQRFKNGSKCILYGLYVVHPRNAGDVGIFSMMRVDRVICDDGLNLIVQFEIGERTADPKGVSGR